jgi:CheY-like chemotaxis protein
MSDPSSEERPPSVLLVSDHDWLALALGSAAAGWGYTVGRASSVAQALHVADALNPDVVFVDAWIGAAGGARVPAARALRDAGAITPATPVLSFSADPLTREERLAALDGGVWDVVELPVDTSVLRMRLATWVAGKRYADRLERASLHDREAPIYNLRGLLSRARELGADAARGGTPLACVAIAAGMPRPADADDAVSVRAEQAEEGERLRAAWNASGRASDVIGRVGRAEFVVLAPRTRRGWRPRPGRPALSVAARRARRAPHHGRGARADDVGRRRRGRPGQPGDGEPATPASRARRRSLGRPLTRAGRGLAARLRSARRTTTAPGERCSPGAVRLSDRSARPQRPSPIRATSRSSSSGPSTTA